MQRQGSVVSALTSDKFNEWTDCETNGHRYEPCDCPNNEGSCTYRVCVECDDEYDTQDL